MSSYSIRILILATLMTATSISSAAEAQAMDVSKCKKALIQAKKLDMLYDVRAERIPIGILVGPTWFKVPIDAKEGFSAVVACVLGDGKNLCTPFDLLDYRTAKPVARWRMCKLQME